VNVLLVLRAATGCGRVGFVLAGACVHSGADASGACVCLVACLQAQPLGDTILSAEGSQERECLVGALCSIGLGDEILSAEGSQERECLVGTSRSHGLWQSGLCFAGACIYSLGL
jgi:hypothetical protein